MIIEAIFNAIAFIVIGIVNLFPTIPAIDTSFLSGFFRILSLLDTFVSLRILSACMVIVFIFMNIQTVWNVIMWVVRKLPGVN